MDHYNGARYIPAPTWIDQLAPDPRDQRPPKQQHDQKKKSRHHKHRNKDQERYERHISDIMAYPPPQGYQVVDGDYGLIGTYPPPGYAPNGPWVYPVPYEQRTGQHKKHKKHKKKDKKNKAQKLPKPSGPVPYFGFLAPPPEDYYARHIEDPRYDRLPREINDPAGFFGDSRQPKKRLPRTNFFEEETPENPTYATTITRSSVGNTLERPSPRSEPEPVPEPEPEREQEIEEEITPYGDHTTIAPRPQQIPGPRVFVTTNPTPVYAVINKRKSAQPEGADDAIHPSITEEVLKDFDRQFADYDTTPQSAILQGPPQPNVIPGIDRSPYDFRKSRRVLTEMLGERTGTTPPRVQDTKPVAIERPEPPRLIQAPPPPQPPAPPPPPPPPKQLLQSPQPPPPPPPPPPPSQQQTEECFFAIPEPVGPRRSIVVKERIEPPRELNEVEKTFEFPIEDDDFDDTIESLAEEESVPNGPCRVIGGLPEEQYAYVKEVEQIRPKEVPPEIDQYLLDSLLQEHEKIVPEEVDLYPPQEKKNVEEPSVPPYHQGDIAYQKGTQYADEHPIVPEEVQLLYDNDAVPPGNQAPKPLSLPPMQNGPISYKVDLRKETGTLERADIIAAPAPLEQPKPRPLTYERVDLRQQAGTILKHPPATTVPLPRIYDGPPSLQVDSRAFLHQRPSGGNTLAPTQAPADVPRPVVEPTATLAGVRFQSALPPSVNLNSNSNNNNVPPQVPIQKQVPPTVPLIVPPTIQPTVKQNVQQNVPIIVPPNVPPTFLPTVPPAAPPNVLPMVPPVFPPNVQTTVPKPAAPLASLPPQGFVANKAPIALQPGLINYPQGRPNAPEGFFPVKNNVPNMIPAPIINPNGPFPQGVNMPNTILPGVPILENSGLPEGYYFLNPAVPMNQNPKIPTGPRYTKNPSLLKAPNAPFQVAPVTSKKMKTKGKVPVKAPNPPIQNSVLPAPPSNTLKPGMLTEVPGLPGKYYIVDPAKLGVKNSNLPEGYYIVSPPAGNASQPPGKPNIQKPIETNVPKSAYPVTLNTEEPAVSRSPLDTKNRINHGCSVVQNPIPDVQGAPDPVPPNNENPSVSDSPPDSQNRTNPGCTVIQNPIATPLPDPTNSASQNTFPPAIPNPDNPVIQRAPTDQNSLGVDAQSTVNSPVGSLQQPYIPPATSAFANPATAVTYMPQNPATTAMPESSNTPNPVTPMTYIPQSFVTPAAYATHSSALPTTNDFQNPAIPATYDSQNLITTSASPETLNGQNIEAPSLYDSQSAVSPDTSTTPEAAIPGDTYAQETGIADSDLSSQEPATLDTSEPQGSEIPDDETIEASEEPEGENEIEESDTVDSDSSSSSDEEEEPHRHSKNPCVTQ